MLKSKSKTIIQINFLGHGGLADFIAECYNLPHRWTVNAGHNGEYQLFEILENDEEHDMKYALEVIQQGHGEDWGDLQYVLTQLCFEKFIPPGNYLVKPWW